MIKKSLTFFCMIFIIAFIILSALVAAQNKIQIETKDSFKAGEKITFKVSLYDAQNNLINENVDVVIEDAEKRTTIKETVLSNKLFEVDLGEGARQGYWTITAKYQDTEIKQFFTVEINEFANFTIEGDKLIVTNIGNTRYTKTIDIIIGDSLGTKKVDLDIGEKVSFRLIAPDGVYSVTVSDGKTKTSKSDVSLTGNAIGILDERLTTGGNPLTGGIKPESETDESFYSAAKNRRYVYVFLLVIIGAAILLAIERNYRKKL